MKNIWIINQYTSTPKLGGGGNRSYYFGKEFKKRDYHVTLITSSFSHVPKRNYPISTNFLFDIEEENFNLIVVKNIVYKSGRSLLRIISMVIFCLKLFIIPLKGVRPPQFIIVSSISLLPILNAFYIKYRYKNRPKIILEIRDIWPLSLIEIGGFSRFNPFVIFLGWIEKIGYKHADYITAVQPLAYLHIEKIANKSINFEHVPNGIHISSIKNDGIIDDEIKRLLPDNKLVIGYTGSLGEANAMEYFIEAANNCIDMPFYFVIVGEGYKAEELKRMALGDNVLFIPAIPKSQVQSMLSLFDVLYLGSKNEKIYEFGISAIKTYEYMFAGKPILRSCLIAGDEIVESGCGIAVEAENYKAIIDGINIIYRMSPEERMEMGKKGHNYVIKHRTFEKLADKYIGIFNSFNNKEQLKMGKL